MKSLLPRLACFLILTTGTLCAADAPPVRNPATMMPDEWVQYRLERVAVIQANPELAAEQKALDAEFRAQADEVNAAMIKADSKTAPVIASVKKLLHSKWDAKGPGTISIEEWQALRASRAAALQADPALGAKNRALLKKQAAFKKKVDSALTKADPTLAPFIQELRKSEGGR